MKKIINICFILGFVFVLSGCGGGGGGSTSTTSSNTTTLNVGDSMIVPSGASVTAQTADTQINIVTDVESGDNNLTVLVGQVIVTQ